MCIFYRFKTTQFQRPLISGYNLTRRISIKIFKPINYFILGGIRGSLIIVIALHIIKIIIGSLYLHDCPIDKKIPIFLIVAGKVSSIYFT